MNLTIEEQYKVYNYYLSSFLSPRRLTIGKSMLCPFPDAPESKPSFTIFFSKDKTALLYKMFNSGSSGNVYKFVARMEEGPAAISPPKIRKILRETAQEFVPKNLTTSYSPDPIITVRNHFTLPELKWWENEAGLIEEDLIELDIYPLQSLCYKPNKVSMASTPYEMKFVYVFYNSTVKITDNIIAWQIYNPRTRDSQYKWRSGSSESVIGNYWNLPPTADKLFITTSKKDGGVLWKHVLNKKYPFIHPDKEMSIDPIIQKSAELKKRFKEIIYIPDIEYRGLNKKGKEAPGLINAKKLKYEAGIPYLDLQYPTNAKDITELYKIDKLNLIHALL